MVAHVCHVFPTFVAGGAQVRTVRLMNAFGDRFRHSVIALDGATSATELIDPEVRVEVVKPPRRGGSLATIRGLRRVLATIGPELVCTYNWGAIEAIVAGRLSGARGVIHHEDGFGPEEAARQLPRRVWTRRCVLPLTRALIVPAASTLEIARRQWKVGARRVHHVPIGIDVASYPRADGHPELRRELKIAPDAWVIGYVGHLRAEKNPVRLAEAFGQLMRELEAAGSGSPSTRPHLLMLGDGPMRDDVEETLARYDVGKHVSLVGYQSAPERYYRLMNSLTISSNTEAMPINLLEGMSSHLPVASTDVGDVKRMLPTAQAELVTPIHRDDEPETRRRLTASLRTLVTDPERARRLGTENHAHVARTYSFEGMLRAFGERYEAALGTR